MFAKKRTAVWGLRGTFVLLLIAVYCPLLASGLPIVWRDPGGALEYPFFAKLFDRNYWENGVDRFFNLLMVAVTLAFLVRLALQLAVREPARRRAILRPVRPVFAGLVLLVGFLQAFGVSFLLTSSPYRDYRTARLEVRRAEDLAWAAEAWGAASAALRRDLADGGRAIPTAGVADDVAAAVRALSAVDSDEAGGLASRLEALLRGRLRPPAHLVAQGAPAPPEVLDAGLRLEVERVVVDLDSMLADRTRSQAGQTRQVLDRTLGAITARADVTAALDAAAGAGEDAAEVAGPFAAAAPEGDRAFVVGAVRHRLALSREEAAPATVVAARRAWQEAHTVVTTVVPYGHREQLPFRRDQFRGFFDLSRGERHLMGTDEIGRDIFTRLLYGTRISLTVGLVAVSLYVAIGTLLGAIAGYAGGWADIVIMRIVEVVLCVPGLFLILTIIALFENRSIFMIMGAIGLVGWTGIARLVRGEFLRERARDYVTAARSLGLSGTRILFRHVLPNSVGPVIVSATFGVAAAIITESTLSFLGLGDPTVPSWGQVLNDGRMTGRWHMILPPGVAIFVTVTLLNLVGDGMRDALDPKLRR